MGAITNSWKSSTYDGFDNLITHTQTNGTTTTTTTNYTYDPLNRLASQTTGTATTSYSYLGLTSELAKETDPGSQTKNYSYTPAGMRLFQTTTSSTGTVTPGYYSYNNHGDVEAVTGANGNTTATYGYTAYGSNITSMFTGADKNNTSPGTSTTPYNSYRYNGMRWDPGSGQYDMGFRNYDPGLNSFVSRDMYNGALSDMSLTTDPFTGSRYAFGDGNPISSIGLDGHTQCDAGVCPTQQQTRQVTATAAQYGSGCPSTKPGCASSAVSTARTGSGRGRPVRWASAASMTGAVWLRSISSAANTTVWSAGSARGWGIFTPHPPQRGWWAVSQARNTALDGAAWTWRAQ